MEQDILTGIEGDGGELWDMEQDVLTGIEGGQSVLYACMQCHNVAHYSCH